MEYSDDFVAGVLAKDAAETSSRYPSLGLSSLSMDRYNSARAPYGVQPPETNRDKFSQPGSAPKPNTRFLKNIIRETKSHNAALLAKERLDARAREKELARIGRHRSENSYSHARDARQHGRRRSRDGNHRHRATANEHRHGHKGKHKHRSRRQNRAEEYEHESRARSRSLHRHRLKRQRRSSSEDENSDHHHSRHQSREALTHGDHAIPRLTPSDASNVPRPTQKTRRDSSHRHTKDEEDQAFSRESSISSDPLESFVGPLPRSQIRSRGRGAQHHDPYRETKHTNINKHFSSNYNPELDIDDDAEERDMDDDWGMALEALRDRAKWRVQGAERLRSAGFSERQVERWEKNDAHSDGRAQEHSDVKWSRKGEGREWDRGKVVDLKDGEGPSVQLRPAWVKGGNL